MRFMYDTEADALLITLFPGLSVTRTVEVDESRHVDLSDDDHPVQIEVLFASSGVYLDDIIDQFDLHDFKLALEDVVHAQRFFRPSVPV